MGKRSNGCVTCRKRKVKCDEGKPECDRCKKATYQCKGYDQPWLDETPFRLLADQRRHEEEAERRERQDATVPQGAVAAKGFLPLDSVTQPMRLSAFQDDICRSFVFHKLTGGSQPTKAMTWWLSSSPRVEVQSRTLVSASRAMTASMFGNIHQQPRIAHEGRVMYGEAIRNLKSDLAHPIKAYTIETLGATMALSMFEPGTPPGWITHAQGVAKLIEHRGPQRHQQYPEKTIFIESRMTLICNGIYICQRTFMEEQQWKDGPWENDPSSKSHLDCLVDVLADIPGFLERVLYNDPSSGGLILNVQAENEALQVQLLGLLHNLATLHNTWKTKSPNASREIKNLNRALPPELEATNSPYPPFECVFYFENMMLAYQFIIFNSVLILALELLLSVCGPQVVNSVLVNIFPDIPNCSIQSLATHICQTAEYLYLNIHHSRGYIVFTFPATIAYMVLDKESPAARYLYDMCTLNAGINGFGFGAFALEQPTPLSVWIDGLKEQNHTTSPLSHATTETPVEEDMT
ncbi:hypothetical protein P7C71_g1331, partial [Lecanoromycetidae sp. Uapishka_2]